jgi:DNA polymerase-3 subunit beta
MNIIYPKNKLLKYLSYTDTISSSKTTIPVLSNVLITAEEDAISLNASNLETGIRIVDTAEVKEQGALAVNGKKLTSIIRELPDSDVSLSTDEHNRMTIQSTSPAIKARFVVAGLQREDFPDIKTEPEGEYIQLKAEEFKNMIKKVVFSISTDENKYSLTGVFFEKDDNGINMVATDGKRLSLISKTIEELEIAREAIHIPHDGIIIPKIVLSEIIRYSFESNKIYMGFSKNQIFFSYDNIHLTSNLIEGKFPEYKKIIPDERGTFFLSEKTLLFSAIRRVSVLVDESYNQIKLSILKNKLLISSKNPSMGGAVEEIPVEYDGEDIDIAVNYLYLIDCLKEISSDTVKIDFENAERVVTVRGKDETNYVNLIMPMKINL